MCLFTAPADGKCRYMRLSVFLHGQPLRDSPLWIAVHPSACDVTRTTVVSTFTTVVASREFAVRLQLHDAYGNRMRSTPGAAMTVDDASSGRGLLVEGPPPHNAEGINVLRWGSRIPGTIDVSVEVTVPAPECVVPIRLQYLKSGLVVPFAVEVISEDTYQRLIEIKRGPRWAVKLSEWLAHAKSVVPTAARDSELEKRNTQLLSPAAQHDTKVAALERKKIKDRIGLYFRKSLRRAEAARRRADIASVGGVRRRKFPETDK
jgi:hypothetical protein